MGIKVFFFLSLFYILPAHAEVTIETVSGSSQNIGTDPVTTVWGVFVGTYLSGATTEYNNCGFSLDDSADSGTVGTGGAFHGCHEARVNGDSALTIRFKESSDVTGLRAYAVIPPATGDTGSANRKVGENTTTVSGSNQTATVPIKWRDLCNQIKTDASTFAVFDETTQTCALSGDPNTKISGSLTVSVGLGTSHTDLTATKSITIIVYSPDPALGVLIKPATCGTPVDGTDTNFGFCDLAVAPGDEGGYLYSEDEATHQNEIHRPSFTIANAFDAYGASTSITNEVEEVRLFISSTSFVDAQPYVASAKSADLLVTETPSNIAVFDDNRFGGLKNSTTEKPISYFVRASTIDSSGTVSQLMDDATYCPGGTCPDFNIIPSQVAGIIAENSCFITTATYGSDQAHQVNLFRKFRKQFLFTNKIGHKIIHLYNVYGPMGADWIRSHPSSKKYAQVALYPFYGFAYLSVHYGLFTALAAYLGLVLLLFGLINPKAFSKIK
ncbi:MAG: CFI-box-CTERM domain-containing protein [Bdellovibrionales bacterium]